MKPVECREAFETPARHRGQMHVLQEPPRRVMREDPGRRAVRAETTTARAEVGDSVYAGYGDPLGRVEQVITSEDSAPVFLVVSTGGLLKRRYPVIPWSLVKGVDRRRRRLYLEGTKRVLARLSETLPIVT
jgi:hypothetical protein